MNEIEFRGMKKVRLVLEYGSQHFCFNLSIGITTGKRLCTIQEFDVHGLSVLVELRRNTFANRSRVIIVTKQKGLHGRYAG